MVHIANLKPWDLHSVLTQKYSWASKDAHEFAQFLLPMLEYDQKRRATALQCLENRWILEPKGSIIINNSQTDVVASSLLIDGEASLSALSSYQLDSGYNILKSSNSQATSKLSIISQKGFISEASSSDEESNTNTANDKLKNVDNNEKLVEIKSFKSKLKATPIKLNPEEIAVSTETSGSTTARLNTILHSSKTETPEYNRSHSHE